MRLGVSGQHREPAALPVVHWRMGFHWPAQPPVLTDGVVTLRVPAERDVDAITEGARDPLVQRFTMVPRPYERSDAEWFVVAHGEPAWGSVSPRLGHEGAEPRLNAAFAITDDEDRLLGVIGLHDVDPDAATGEVGYWLGPWARGRGVMTRALGLLLDWAFEEAGLREVRWVADQENGASRVVAERHGFVMGEATTCGRPGQDPVPAWSAVRRRVAAGQA